MYSDAIKSNAKTEKLIYKDQWFNRGLLTLVGAWIVFELTLAPLILSYLHKITDGRNASVITLAWIVRIVGSGVMLGMFFYLRGRILVELTDLSLKVRQGFSAERIIPYKDITSISKITLSKSDLTEYQKRFRAQDPYTYHNIYCFEKAGSGIYVKLGNGLSYFIQSQQADRILSMLKEASPSLLQN